MCVLVSHYYHGHRGTTKPLRFLSWDVSRSSRSVPQETGVQLTARIQLTQYISPLNISRTNLIFPVGQRRRICMKCNPPSKKALIDPVGLPPTTSEYSVGSLSSTSCNLLSVFFASCFACQPAFREFCCLPFTHSPMFCYTVCKCQ